MIDRDRVLDEAEHIVATEGAGALTIDAVAKRAGITKGGVQSCFGTKEAMVEAMLRRWTLDYEAQVTARLNGADEAIERIRAHVDVTCAAEDETNARSASLMALLLQSPDHLVWIRSWYRERLAGLDPSTPEGRHARLAFLAMEGAFLLRFFGLMDLQDDWTGIGRDISAMLPPAAAKPAGIN